MNIRLEDLEYIDCDNCRSVGKYRRLGKNHFVCKVCGEEFRCEPCPSNCPDHIAAPEGNEGKEDRDQ